MADVRLGGVRKSNIELFRIILMYFMIMHHYVVNSGVMGLFDLSAVSANMILLQLAGMFGKTGINCFTLITGYFMVKSNITVRKFLKIYLEMKFYYLISYLLFLLTGYEIFSIKRLIKVVFSVIYEGGVLYSGTYVMFLLVIPFLNLLIKNMTKRQHEILILIVFMYFTFFSTFFFVNNFDYIGWLAAVYMVGAYMRIYPLRWDRLKVGIAGTLLSILFMAGSIIFVDYVGSRYGFENYYYLVVDANKILAITCAVFLFVLFKNIEMGYCRFINWVSASTFGILLFHTNSDAMRRLLWVDIFRNTEYYSSPYLFIHIFGASFAVFVMGMIVDKIRIALVMVCVKLLPVKAG